MLLLLIFAIVLLPNAFTLKCYECQSGLLLDCADARTECPSPSRCASLGVFTSFGGRVLGNVSLQTCAAAEQCIEGSINLGISRAVLTSKCCNSDLCNAQPAPVPTESIPNGNKCFSCDHTTCTKTVACEGNEDRCFSTTGALGSAYTAMKGCASQLMCSSSHNAQILGVIGVELKCCQGNYCNSGSSSSAGPLLLVAPLILLGMLS